MAQDPTQKVELELMWEGIESFYFSYANGWAYMQNLNGWHQGIESTIVLDLHKRSVRCYYDRHEMQRASEEALPDFLNQGWVDRFLSYSQELLQRSQAFIKEVRLTSSGIERGILIDRIARGTKLTYETLLTFMVTQPQYTWGIESHVFSRMSDIPPDKKQEVIACLAQSTEPSLFTEEEDAWSALVKRIKERYESLPPEQDTFIVSSLGNHVLRYGLVYASDSQSPADQASLYVRLGDSWNRSNLVKDRAEERRKIENEKRTVIKEYGVPDEVVQICITLARMSHIRLETRLRGWMPLEKVVVHELIPELTRFLPYTAEQLESCTPSELEAIIQEKLSLSPEELEERRKHVVVGIIKGKEFLWTGKAAEENLPLLLADIDYNAKELTGQIAMKGKVVGPCHIISWESDISAMQIENMIQGAVLVAGQTRPQLMEAIKKAAAIVTDEGGLLSHAAIVSRELRIPCVIGTKYATKILKQGDMVEVDAEKGVVRRLDS